MNRSKLPAGLATLSILLAACGATSTGPAAAGCTNLNAFRTGGGSAGSAAVKPWLLMVTTPERSFFARSCAWLYRLVQRLVVRPNFEAL